jgi:hypothetical protein
MLVARVRATESRTLGTGSQLRSRRCGKMSRANNSSGRICFITSWEQSSANVWRWIHRLLWANHSASSPIRPRSKRGSVDTCFTSSVTCNIYSTQNFSLANLGDFHFLVKVLRFSAWCLVVKLYSPDGEFWHFRGISTSIFKKPEQKHIIMILKRESEETERLKGENWDL